MWHAGKRGEGILMYVGKTLRVCEVHNALCACARCAVHLPFWTQVHSALSTQQILCTCMHSALSAQVWLHI